MRKPENGTHFTAIDTPPKVGIMAYGPSRTRQSDAKAADINTIMRQYERTGMIPQVDSEALFVDVSEMPDYRTALDFIRKADNMFMDLPAEIRKKFDNDPAVFLSWTSDPDNREEMIELGMLPRPEVVEEPVVVPPVVEPVVSPAVPPAVAEEG